MLKANIPLSWSHQSIKKILIPLLIFGITTIIVFFPYSISIPLKYFHLVSPDNNLFLIQSDYLQQYVPFYEEFFRLAESHQLGWSANEMFGISFYASKGYYLIGDIFTWMMYGLHHIISNTLDILLVVTMLKLVIAGFTFNHLLSQFKISFKIRMVYSIFYMLSGWMTIFIEQPVFISFYAFAPLLITALVKTIIHHKPSLLLVLSSALCIATQYYLCWMLCVLLLIGWCVYHIVNKTSFKQFVSLSLRTLLYFCIGVGISAVIWLPSLLHMLSNPRLGFEELNTYWLYEPKDLLSLVKNAYIPVLKYSDHSYRSYWYYFYQTGIYANVFNILIFPVFLLNHDIPVKLRKTIGICFALLILTLVSPQISKVFHFTYSLRYTYGFMLLLLVSGALWLNRRYSASRKLLLINGIVQYIICFVLGIAWPLLEGSTLSTPDVKLSLISCILIVVYTGLLLGLTRYKSNIVPNLLLCLMVIESTVYSKYSIKGQQENASTYAPYIDGYQRYKQTIEALKAYDSGFYRVHIVNGELNDNLVYNIPSTNAYDSVYQFTLHDFLQWIRQYPDVSWSFSVDVPDLDPLLNVRYVLLDTPTAEQMGYYKYWADEVDLGTPVTILKLKETAAFARTVTSIEPESSIEKYSDETIPLNGLLTTMKNTIIVDDETYESLLPLLSSSETCYDPTHFSDTSWDLNVDATNKSILLFVSQAYDKGWKFTNQDGQSIESISVDGGFTGLILPENTTSIHATYEVPGSTIGSIISISSIVIYFILFIKQQHQQSN